MKKVISTIFGIILFLSTFAYTQPNSFIISDPDKEVIEEVQKNLESNIEELIKETDPYETEFSILAEQLLPTVVSVDVNFLQLDKTGYEKTGRVFGSGIFITPNGHILTCAHVFHGVVTGITIETKDGIQYGGELLFIDRNRDLALIKIYSDEDTPYVNVAKRDVKVGESVIAIGYPFGLVRTFTTGVVSGIDRTMANAVKHIQIDAVINPGSSGGPLLDMAGDLIGITVQINMRIEGTVYVRIWSGQGFAVATNEIRMFLERFKGL